MPSDRTHAAIATQQHDSSVRKTQNKNWFPTNGGTGADGLVALYIA